jgi:hypothetical protein
MHKYPPGRFAPADTSRLATAQVYQRQRADLRRLRYRP